MNSARASLALALGLTAACGAPAPAPAPAPPAREPEFSAPAPEHVEPVLVPVVPAEPSVVLESVAPPVVAPEEPRAPEPLVAADDAAQLGAEVAALLAARCHECHGPGKRPKGGLRLSDLASVLARPAEEALVVRGDAAASPLYARLVLSEDDEDRMPPEGAPLGADELALVRRWIEAGAPLPPQVEAAASARAEETLVALEAEARAARDRALAALTRRGAHARLLAAAGDAVEVDLAVALPPAGAAELAALAGLEPCLVELSLVRLALADADLAALAPFTELRRLRLGETPLGDGAAAALVPLVKLESLDLFGTRVSDAAVPHLARLTALRRLYLGGTALTPDGIEALAAALPGCTLVR